MSKHTPAPWVYLNDQYCGSIWSEVNGKPFVRVAGFIDCEVSDETEANAKHIIKCVNERENLVSALRECQEYFSGENDRGKGGYLDNVADMVNEVLDSTS